MRIDYCLKSVCLILSLTLSAMVFAAPKMVDRVAAIVNNSVILESNVDDMIKTVKSNINPNELPDRNTLRHQVIDRLITEQLILDQSKKLGLNITDADVTEAINRIAQQHQMTVPQLADKLAKTGISFTDYQARIRKEMMIEETRSEEVRRRIIITPQEVDALARARANKPPLNQEVNVSHILIAVPESSSRAQLNEARQKANLIVSKLKAGASFSKLATTYSNDDLALSGGAIGWKKPGELPSLFESKVAHAGKNTIIGPLQSAVGFHILKVNDVHREGKSPVTVLEIKARHILMKTNLIQNDAQVKAKLMRIRKDILTHKITFNNAAKQFSEDPGTKNRGGELGWAPVDHYDGAFATALLKLKKNEISLPIKSSFGWHLIQLLDTRKEDRTKAAQKEQAYQLIFNRKFAEESQVWLQELRSDAYINIIDNVE